MHLARICLPPSLFLSLSLSLSLSLFRHLSLESIALGMSTWRYPLSAENSWIQVGQHCCVEVLRRTSFMSFSSTDQYVLSVLFGGFVKCFGLVIWLNGIPTCVVYLIPDPVYIYIHIYVCTSKLSWINNNNSKNNKRNYQHWRQCWHIDATTRRLYSKTWWRTDFSHQQTILITRCTIE